MKTLALLMIILCASLSDCIEVHAKLREANELNKPLGLVNLDGVCYANATLEALFHLEKFNEFLIAKQKKITKTNLLSLRSYLRALKTYRKTSANPVFYSLIQGTYSPSVKLHSYKGIVNDQNEPTEIIQNILLDLKQLTPRADILFNLLPPIKLKEIVNCREVKETAKIILKTSASKYAFVMLDNPSAHKLYDLTHHKRNPSGELILPITIKTEASKNYKLVSIVSSSKLTQYHSSKQHEQSTEGELHGPNHSTAYVNIQNQWFYFNDQEVRKVDEAHIRSYLKGEPCLMDRKDFFVEQYAPGILIYERK